MSAVTYTHTRPSYQNGGEIKVATQLILQIPLRIDKLVYFDQMFYYYKTKYFIKNYCTNKVVMVNFNFCCGCQGLGAVGSDVQSLC